MVSNINLVKSGGPITMLLIVIMVSERGLRTLDLLMVAKIQYDAFLTAYYLTSLHFENIAILLTNHF